MESESPLPLFVNTFTSENGGKIPSPGWGKTRTRLRDRRSKNLYFWLIKYFRGAFADGAPYLEVRKVIGSWCRSKGFSFQHVMERVFPGWRKWCTEYVFEKVRIKKTWVWLAKPNVAVCAGVSVAEATARLVGAIRVCLGKSGVAHVDPEFCRKFSIHAKIAYEAVLAAWRKIEKIAGCRVRWRGVGDGEKFVVTPEPRKIENSNQSSDPQTSPGLSSLREKKSENRGCAPGPERDAAGLRPPVQRPEVTTGEGDLPPKLPDSRCPSRRSGFEDRNHGMPARFAAISPWLVGERIVVPWHLWKKACWIANQPLKKIHAQFERVAFDKRHAGNFAMESLLCGYTEEQICRAWWRGVRQSHEDALERDRLPGGGYASVRLPSAAKNYAIREIKLMDSRSVEARWLEFFAKGPRASDVGCDLASQLRGGAGEGAAAARGVGSSAAVPEADPLRHKVATHVRTGTPRLSAKDAAAQLAALRAKLQPPADDGRPSQEQLGAFTQGDLAAALAAREISFAQWAGFPYSVKTSLIRTFIAAKNK